MSFSTYVEGSKEKEEVKKEPLSITKANISKIVSYCQQKRQDWVFFVTGLEGSGKSTVAAQLARILDPQFSLQEGMIYDFRDSEQSFLNFMLKYQDVPYSVAWYDEAVTVLFSQQHNTKDSALAQKIFKIKRDCRHFDILVSPSFWDIVPDIRERRVKSLLYCFTTIHHPAQGRTEFRYHVAYFSGEKIIRLSQNRKAKTAFRSYKALFKLVKPDYVEDFPAMPARFEKEYFKFKRDHRMGIIEDAAGMDETKGTNKLLQPESGRLDFSGVRQQLIEAAGVEVEE